MVTSMGWILPAQGGLIAGAPPSTIVGEPTPLAQETTMRRILAALLAATALAAVAAGTASADVANPNVKPISNGQFCQNWQSYGVYGQYGAWGYFVDGCTARASCPSWMSVCAAQSHSSITTFRQNGHLVTQNARLRVFSRGGVEYWHRDQSCGPQVNKCSSDDLVYIRGGETATDQCNGVVEKRGPLDEAVNGCQIQVIPLY
jgi:hypothetical protein